MPKISFSHNNSTLCIFNTIILLNNLVLYSPTLFNNTNRMDTIAHSYFRKPFQKRQQKCSQIKNTFLSSSKRNRQKSFHLEKNKLLPDNWEPFNPNIKELQFQILNNFDNDGLQLKYKNIIIKFNSR